MDYLYIYAKKIFLHILLQMVQAIQVLRFHLLELEKVSKHKHIFHYILIVFFIAFYVYCNKMYWNRLENLWFLLHGSQNLDLVKFNFKLRWTKPQTVSIFTWILFLHFSCFFYIWFFFSLSIALIVTQCATQWQHLILFFVETKRIA